MSSVLNEKILRIREKSSHINFIQIGAYDGVSLDDAANEVLNENDRGIFIEPNPYILDTLRYNKRNFISSKILPFAVIPNSDFYHKHFHVDKFSGQSSFVKGLTNEEKVENEKYEVVDVQCITVEDLFKKYVNFNVDVIFTDCEGYDYDINKKILEFCKPEILYMEAWNIEENTFDCKERQKLITKQEMFEFLKVSGYEIIYDQHGENLTCYLK